MEAFETFARRVYAIIGLIAKPPEVQRTKLALKRLALMMSGIQKPAIKRQALKRSAIRKLTLKSWGIIKFERIFAIIEFTLIKLQSSAARSININDCQETLARTLQAHISPIT
ncbi:hypothetical protein [Bartonella apihabitans]|uniref:hypothetical protein n=1 Tax=Bartonella apihabitans TaxID=2750929 RepID=UPI001AEE0145|nr:hypothetical protein [Bartonella apihabitans]